MNKKSTAPTLIWHFSAATAALAQDGLARALAAHGFRLADGAVARAAARERNGPGISIAQDGPTAALLDAGPLPNCALAAWLRKQWPALAIVAVCDGHHPADIARQLHSGADAYCHAAGEPELVVALVRRLCGRGSAPDSACTSSAMGAQAWGLVQDGWVLRLPHGAGLALSPGERAFLLTLLQSEAGQASHARLLAAVNAAYGRRTGDRRLMRLGMLVSRLRRRLAARNAVLPLRSVHGWGYCWSGELPLVAALSEA